ncbi:MAG: diacylglycerol kinase family protein [bacterium]
MSPFHHILLIVNPVSGLAQGVRIGQRLQKRLQGSGCHCAMRRTEKSGDASAWAQRAGEEGFDLIVAIGGDGTLQEVAAGLVTAPRKIPVAHVPVGTANVIAIALSLPWSTRLAQDIILNGQVIPFDVGYLPDLDRHFLLMAAIGYPARIIQDSSRRLKSTFGFLAYIGAAFRHAFIPDQARLRIETENEQFDLDGHTILVTNIGRIKDLRLKVSPTTSPHDGKFDVTIISSRTFWDVLRILFRLLTWRGRKPPRVRYCDAERVTISADPPVPVQIDGEVLGSTPLTARILPGAIEMVVPSSYSQQ